MKKTFAPALAVGIVATALTAGASSAHAAPGVYYPNCKAAIAAQAAPILKTEPGYRLALDADKDGVACDKGLPAGYVKKVAQAPKPTPTKTAPTSKPTPKPTKPAPVVQAPSTPAKPATPAPTAPAPVKPGTGPVVQTDYVAPSDGAASTYGVFALVGAAAGAGAIRVRSLKR